MPLCARFSRSKKFNWHSIGGDVQSKWRIRFLWQFRWIFARLEQYNWSQSGRIEFKLSGGHHEHLVESEIFAFGNGQFECVIVDFAQLKNGIYFQKDFAFNLSFLNNSFTHTARDTNCARQPYRNTAIVFHPKYWNQIIQFKLRIVWIRWELLYFIVLWLVIPFIAESFCFNK